LLLLRWLHVRRRGLSGGRSLRRIAWLSYFIRWCADEVTTRWQLG
jgi:hypothetical protein